MVTETGRCGRAHFEPYHVNAICSLKRRLIEVERDLVTARAALAYACDQVDQLRRDAEAGR